MKKSVMLVLVFIFSIYSASACVEPTDGMIITENTTFCEGEYNLPTGVIIDNNNLVLDCNGASLIGSQTYSFGIFSYDRDNFVIKNCVIENYYTGIKLTSGVNSLNNIKIENNIISGYGEGIGIDTIRLVNGLIRVNNIFDFGEAGINFDLSDNNFIYSNSIYSSNVGILLDHGSKNNELIGNFLCNNDFGLSCFDSENNFGSSNRFDFIENNEGCDFVGFSECTDFSGAQCSLRGGMCSNSIHPGEINLGNCINKPYKELPNIADASDGIRFSSEKNSVIDRIKLFFKNLFVRQSKEILIQNNNCIVSVRSLAEFTVPRCFSGTNGWVNLCSPMMGEVYSYSNSSYDLAGHELIFGQFCSIANLSLYGDCINGDYYIDPATCHDLNEAYNLFGTEVAESTGYNDGEFDWALEWTDSGANSWHESGDYYCGYCGDDLLGPHETNVESESSHWCNDSTFEVVDESSKCYCPSEEDVPALPVVESDGICSNVNDGYESNENDEGHNNGCHDEYSDEICTYGICSNGECMKQYPMEVPDCGGNEWYNDLECTNPTDQCYLGSEHGSYCLGAYGCGGPIQVCGDGVCEDEENCSQDLVGCPDDQCSERTCNDGCDSFSVIHGEDPNENAYYDCSFPYNCNGGNCEPISCDLIDCYSKIYGTLFPPATPAMKCNSAQNNICCKGQTSSGAPICTTYKYCVKNSDPSCTIIGNLNSCCSTSGCVAQLVDGVFQSCVKTSECGECYQTGWTPGGPVSYHWTCSC